MSSIERGLSANTVAAYRRDLTPLRRRAPRQGVSRGRPADDARSWSPTRASLREPADRVRPLAPASIARKLSSIRGFTRFLVEEGELAVDPAVERRAAEAAAAPAEGAHHRRRSSGCSRRPTATSRCRLRDRALLELLYATGARVSEAVALNVDDLVGDDGANEVVRLLGKGSKQRIVPVGSYARAAIEAYLVRARPLLSARGRDARAVPRRTRVRVSAGRTRGSSSGPPPSARTSTSSSRRTACGTRSRRTCSQGGADVRVVQELLGHACVATTQLYTLVTADAMRDVYQTSHPRAR